MKFTIALLLLLASTNVVAGLVSFRFVGEVYFLKESCRGTCLENTGGHVDTSTFYPGLTVSLGSQVEMLITYETDLAPTETRSGFQEYEDSLLSLTTMVDGEQMDDLSYEYGADTHMHVARQQPIGYEAAHMVALGRNIPDDWELQASVVLDNNDMPDFLSGPLPDELPFPPWFGNLGFSIFVHGETPRGIVRGLHVDAYIHTAEQVVAAVPAPPTLWLFASGLVALYATRRKRKVEVASPA